MPQEKNPLLDPNYYSGGNQERKNPLLSSGYYGGSQIDDEEDDLSTAIGRKRSELTNVAQNKDRLKAVLAKTKDPQQQARIKRILEEMDKDDRTGVAGTAEDFARGAVAGVANAPVAALDLALTPADLLGLDAAKEARRGLAERQQLVRETVDPKGTAGTVGEVAGGIAGSAVPYGLAAGATGRVATKLIPGLAKQIATGKVSQKMAKRIIANVGENVIGGSIINALQAMGLPEATVQEKLQSFGIGVGADILFGAGQGAIKPPKTATKALGADQKKPSELADELKKAGDDRKALKEAELQIRKLAKADWQVRNPTGNWMELTRAQRDEITAAMKTKLQGEGAIKQEAQTPEVKVGQAESKAEPDGTEGVQSTSQDASDWAKIIGRELSKEEVAALDDLGVGGLLKVVPEADKAKIRTHMGSKYESQIKRTPEQLENLRNAGGDDDPIIKDIRARTDIGRFEKEKLVEDYKRRVAETQKEVFGKVIRTPQKDLDDAAIRMVTGDYSGTRPVPKLDDNLYSIITRKAESGESHLEIKKFLMENGFKEEADADALLNQWNRRYNAPPEANKKPAGPKNIPEFLDTDEGKKDNSVPNVEQGQPPKASKIPVSDEVRGKRWAGFGENERKSGLKRRGMDESLASKSWDELTWQDRRRLEDFVLSEDELGPAPGVDEIKNQFGDLVEKRFWDRKVEEALKNEPKAEGRLVIHPEGGFTKVPEEYITDWDEWIKDSINFPKSSAKTELDELVKELGITPKKFNELSKEDQSKVAKWITEQWGSRDAMVDADDMRVNQIDADDREVFQWLDDNADVDRSKNIRNLMERLNTDREDAAAYLDRWREERISALENGEAFPGGRFWSQLPGDIRQNILDNVGAAGIEQGDWAKLPPETRKRILERWSPDLMKPRVAKDGPVQQPGPGMLKGKGAPPANQWWNRAGERERGMMIGEYVADINQNPESDLADGYYEWARGYGEEGFAVEEFLSMPFDQLPPGLKDHIDKRILDMYGEPEVDLGRTVHEPDAARRAQLSRPTVPEDINDGFTDIIIDGVRGGVDEQAFVQQLLRFARENELSDEAVMNSLEDATGWKVQQTETGWDLVESPLTQKSTEFQNPVTIEYLGYNDKDGRHSFRIKRDGRSIINYLPKGDNDVTGYLAGATERYTRNGYTVEVLGDLPGATTADPSLSASAQSPSLPTPRASAPALKGPVVPGALAAADLSTLNLDQIDKWKDKIFDALDLDPDNKALLADLDALGRATKALRQPEVIPRDLDGDIVEGTLPEDIIPDLPPLPEAIPPEIEAEIQAELAAKGQNYIPFAGQRRPDYVQEQIVQGPPKPVDETNLMDPLEYTKLSRTSPRKLSDQDLQRVIDETEFRMARGAEEGDPSITEAYKALMDKLAAERAARRPPPPQANIPPAIGGAAIGYAYGLIFSDDENRQSNALAWALAGAGGAHALAKGLHPQAKAKKELFPGHNNLPKVISYEAERQPRTLSTLARARRWYAGIARSTGGLETVYSKSGASAALPTHQNAARMASIFGRWVAVAERWMTNRPVILGPDGEPVYLDAPTLKEVGDLVQGDIENLDEVAVALTTLEQVGKTKRLPMDPVRAHMIVSNATPELIEGAKQMRKYALALADSMVNAGILSADVRDKFAAEQWYTPLQRVFGDGVTKQQIEQLAKLGEVAISPNPVKGRKGGSTMQVKSPFETLQRMTAQYIRAAEYNKIKQQFVGFAKAHPGLELLERVDGKKNTKMETYVNQIMAIKKLMPTIDNDSAARLALALGEDIDPRSPIMTIYEEGTLRSYRVATPVFETFKAMLPSEMNMALRLFATPTQMATRGVVHNPFFVASQFFIDSFQAALMSKYGFRPGIDSVRGWWHAVSRSPQYRRILDLGGPATIQSLPYINPKVSTTAIKTQGSTALETAAKQIKELHPFEAYKTLVAPIAEAARIGEALRALDHGESTIQAVYSAWHVTGNTRMQGHFGAIRAFNLLSMFSRPAISAMDEMVTKAGVNPFRRPDESKSAFARGLKQMGIESDRVVNGAEFMVKGFGLIGLPSMYLWFINKGDDEIDQVRQTESGQRYWFFRGPEKDGEPGQIFKVRKPHVVGQMFGSTLERALDQMYERDPENTIRWVGGLVNDAALNILPQFGVVPAALWGNKIPGLGIPIVPESDLKLEPALMGRPEASNPARVIADKIAPISAAVPQEMGALRRALSPAGLDYVFSTVAGMLGQDAVQALDVAINYYDAELVPANHEWPTIGRIFGRYPAMNTRSVRDFYRKAAKVETAALSLAELLKTNPNSAIDYLQRHQAEVSLASTFQSTRQEINNLRRVVEELKLMLREKQITQAEFRRVEREMLLQIINQTGLANAIANQVMMEMP